MIVIAIEVVLCVYFVLVNAIDFMLIVASWRSLPAFMRLGAADTMRKVTLSFAPPVSVILPAYNEGEQIVPVIHSLLQIRYPQFEVILVNDGSSDDTLERLKDRYGLVPAPQGRYARFKTKALRGMYRSTKYPNVRVIDKENGGKGDALNAGINESRYPLIFVADGDSLYAVDTLEQMTQPFLTDPATVGCGAGIRALNEADTSGGTPVRRSLPRNMLVRFQIVEYLRAGLASRFAWAPLNGIMCLSGACALWKKDVIVAAGGYSTNTVWEDAEMTVRVHHYMRSARKRYRIAFVPAGMCWTSVPETLAALKHQRISWHRHITETVTKHRNMLFGKNMGLVGWFALPAYVLCEWLAPIWLLFGLAFAVVTAILGVFSWPLQLALIVAIFALSWLKMAMAFLLDEVSYRTHSPAEVWALFIAAIFEQLGYRQLLAWWSILGMLQFYARRPIRGRITGILRPSDPPYRPAKHAHQFP
jgi:cellulose synthase/poly-beta-1,6-N-acetylglucosamine synthase-like glycosyltransferase